MNPAVGGPTITLGADSGVGDGLVSSSAVGTPHIVL